MKKYEITFKWKIRDTRKADIYRVGQTTFLVEASSKEKAINQVIECAEHLPSWEFERNGIDLEDYRNKPYCSVFYMTHISKILSIKKAQ